jgi:hypothetical protein
MRPLAAQCHRCELYAAGTARRFASSCPAITLYRAMGMTFGASNGSRTGAAMT